MFPIFLIPTIITILLALHDIKFNNFLPIFSLGFVPVLKGALLYASFVQGLEILLFLSPFLSNRQGIAKPTFVGINLINVAYLVQIIIGIGLLGTDTIVEMLWLGVTVLQLIELSGLPVERFELFLTLPWLINVFTSISLFLYLISYSLVQLFNIQNRKLIIYLVAIVAVSATYLIPNYAWTIHIRYLFRIFTIPFVFVIPFFTLIIAIIRKKGVVKY